MSVLLLASATKKPTSRSTQVLQHVGLLFSEPPGRGRIAIYQVFRQTQSDFGRLALPKEVGPTNRIIILLRAGNAIGRLPV